MEKLISLRNKVDPRIPDQRYAIFSFIPSSKAVPDKNEMYGYMKIRGVFATEEESAAKAKELVEKHEPYMGIKHVEVGKYFPVTTRTDLAKHVDHVYKIVGKACEEDISSFVRAEGNKDRKALQELKNREEQLREDSEREFQLDEDMTDDELAMKYLCLRKGLAMACYQYYSICHKQLKDIELFCRQKLKDAIDMENKFPNLKENYNKKYQESIKNYDPSKSEVLDFVCKCMQKHPELHFTNTDGVFFF